MALRLFGVPASVRALTRGVNVVSRQRSALASPDVLSCVPGTQVTELKNGLRVASADSGSATATVGVFIDAGSRCENEQNNGVANYFEHLAYKGTSKRSQTDLEVEIENLGAQLDVYTRREYTALYAKCLAKDVPKAVEILADVVQNPKLDEAAIARERSVILRELQQSDDDLQQVVFNHLHSTAYQGTPLGQTVLGSTSNIKSIGRSAIDDYIKTYYRGNRIVLAGAGGVKHSELVNLAEQGLGKLPGLADDDENVLEPCRFTGSEIRVRDDAIPLANIAIAVEGVGWSNPDSVPLLLASTLIGSWNNTQGGGGNNALALARASSEANLCHSFKSFNINYKDTGLWGIYYICEPLQCEDMLYNIQNEWMRLCTCITEGEVELAKNLLKSKLLLPLDGPTPVCKDIGRQVLFLNRRVPLNELEQRIDAITVKKLRDVCMQYIYDRCPAVAAVGPVENLPDYNRIRSSMYWLRV